MASTILRGRLAALVMASQMFLLVHTHPLLAEENISSDEKKETVAVTEEATDGVEGIASYYAKRYNGRRTNSGERYDPEKMTAANSELPLGTRVKVVNLANGREVVVTVNDRCRKRNFPFIDLSRAAARKLGFLGKGITKVKIIPLDEESS
jgi:rare lipoprotein A